MTPKQQIIAFLPNLSAADLAEVATALKLTQSLTGSTSGPTARALAEDDWLLAGIVAHLSRVNLLTGENSLFELKRRGAYKEYLKKNAQVKGFLLTLEKQLKSSTRHRPQLALLCAQALHELLESRGYFSVSAMLSQIDKLPEALDSSFPGYISGGLLQYILQVAE